jgi:hypothetical protein
MANEYGLGDLVRITGTFENAAGVDIDPTSVFVKYKDPSGNETSLEFGVDAEVVQDATGIYHVDVDANEAGDWPYRFESTGTGQAGRETEFSIRVSKF